MDAWVGLFETGAANVRIRLSGKSVRICPETWPMTGSLSGHFSQLFVMQKLKKRKKKLLPLGQVCVGDFPSVKLGKVSGRALDAYLVF